MATETVSMAGWVFSVSFSASSEPSKHNCEIESPSAWSASVKTARAAGNFSASSLPIPGYCDACPGNRNATLPIGRSKLVNFSRPGLRAAQQRPRRRALARSSRSSSREPARQPHEWRSSSRWRSSCRAKSRRRHAGPAAARSEEHTSELQSQSNLVCRLLLEKKKKKKKKLNSTHSQISYAVFCLKKTTKHNQNTDDNETGA